MFANIFRIAAVSFFAGLFFSPLSACAQTLTPSAKLHPNGIQPETTLSISATGRVSKAPDMVLISAGVETEGETPGEAVSANATRMNGVIAALRDAGVPEHDIQTFDLSLRPRYRPTSGSGSRSQARQIIGYSASNQVRVKVKNIKEFGGIVDAVVAEGGTTLGQIQFGHQNPDPLVNAARREAMTEALERAELYARAADHRIVRIVSIDEMGRGDFPQPFERRLQAASFERAPTPVSGGEVDYAITVSVVFELAK